MAVTELKRYMFENEISIKELAIGAKLDASNLSRIANGYHIPHPETAYIIADYLGVHVNKLFPNYYTYAQYRRGKTLHQKRTPITQNPLKKLFNWI